MDMGGSTTMAHQCKINMLWNWYTVDACFLSSQWHIHSEVAFAFSVICVFILVALVEGVRRLGRNYDHRISLKLARSSAPASPSGEKGANYILGASYNAKPTWTQQAIRGGFFFVQFGAAYILMLLAMYFNGYIIFAIVLGGTFGHILFGADTVARGPGENGASCC